MGPSQMGRKVPYRYLQTRASTANRLSGPGPCTQNMEKPHSLFPALRLRPRCSCLPASVHTQDSSEARRGADCKPRKMCARLCMLRTEATGGKSSLGRPSRDRGALRVLVWGTALKELKGLFWELQKSAQLRLAAPSGKLKVVPCPPTAQRGFPAKV